MAILGSGMAFLDQTVVNVALAVMQRSLGATVGQMQWILPGPSQPVPFSVGFRARLSGRDRYTVCMRAASVPRIHRYTYRQYLDHETSSNVKHEFIDGDIYAMAGGTIEHAVISMNVGVAISSQLRGSPCIVASSDLKVRVLATDLATYPDVTVICGQVQRDSQSGDVALNPTLVVEVSSKSTEDWDRGEKPENYKQIPSLLACVLVSHRRQQVEVVRRGSDGTWTTEIAGPGQSVSLPLPGCMLAVDDVYRNVDIPA